MPIQKEPKLENLMSDPLESLAIQSSIKMQTDKSQEETSNTSINERRDDFVILGNSLEYLP